jgi:hypothetical protein
LFVWLVGWGLGLTFGWKGLSFTLPEPMWRAKSISVVMIKVGAVASREGSISETRMSWCQLMGQFVKHGCTGTLKLLMADT